MDSSTTVLPAMIDLGFWWEAKDRYVFLSGDMVDPRNGEVTERSFVTG